MDMLEYFITNPTYAALANPVWNSWIRSCGVLWRKLAALEILINCFYFPALLPRPYPRFQVPGDPGHQGGQEARCLDWQRIPTVLQKNDPA